MTAHPTGSPRQVTVPRTQSRSRLVIAAGGGASPIFRFNESPAKAGLSFFKSVKTCGAGSGFVPSSGMLQIAQEPDLLGASQEEEEEEEEDEMARRRSVGIL